MSKQEIKEQAYLLWEEEGKPEGRDEEFYEQAEQLCKERERSNYKINWTVKQLIGDVFVNTEGIERVNFLFEPKPITEIRKILKKMEKII